MEVLIDLSGVPEVNRFLVGLDAKKISNDIMDTVGPILLNKTRQRFLAQTDPDGNKWVESFAAIHRRSIGRDGGTLFDRGVLFHSIQYAKRGDSRVFGTDVPYASNHQNGVGVIKRVFLGFSHSDVLLVNKAADRVIAKAVSGG